MALKAALKGNRKTVGSNAVLVAQFEKTMKSLSDFREIVQSHPGCVPKSKPTSQVIVPYQAKDTAGAVPPIHRKATKYKVQIADIDTEPEITVHATLGLFYGLFVGLWMFLAPTVWLLKRLRVPIFRTLQLAPIVIVLLLLGWLVCACTNLVLHPEIWIDVWLYPFELVPGYFDYAWKRMVARFQSKVGSMFALALTS